MEHNFILCSTDSSPPDFFLDIESPLIFQDSFSNFFYEFYATPQSQTFSLSETENSSEYQNFEPSEFFDFQKEESSTSEIESFECQENSPIEETTPQMILEIQPLELPLFEKENCSLFVFSEEKRGQKYTITKQPEEDIFSKGEFEVEIKEMNQPFQIITSTCHVSRKNLETFFTGDSKKVKEKLHNSIRNVNKPVLDKKFGEHHKNKHAAGITVVEVTVFRKTPFVNYREKLFFTEVIFVGANDLRKDSKKRKDSNNRNDSKKRSRKD